MDHLVQGKSEAAPGVAVSCWKMLSLGKKKKSPNKNWVPLDTHQCPLGRLGQE